MQRRSFLQLTSAIGILPIIPNVLSNTQEDWLTEFNRTGVLINKTITLKEKLVTPQNSTIINCTFIASEGFNYDGIMLRALNGTRIINSRFINNGSTQYLSKFKG